MSLLPNNPGYCLTCDSHVTFSAQNEWLRDNYLCSNCGSIPRERALIACIEKFYPNWRDCSIHESSPAIRGASLKLKQHCVDYQATQFFPMLPPGAIHQSGWRNENLERQTFADQSFDLVITQDVIEHVFNPAQAFAEIARTLKPNGAHIFTVPIVNRQYPSELCAYKTNEGQIVYLREAEYHGNPVDDKGALVVMNWGYDICDFILKTSGLYTTIIIIDDLSLGIRAEYIEVLVSRKLAG